MNHRTRCFRGQSFLVLCALTIPLAAVAAEPIEIARGAGTRKPQQPQIAIDGTGGVHVVFGIGDKVSYRRSGDGAKTFTKTVELSLARAMSLGMRRGPRIAVTDAAICISAIGGKQGKGRDGDLLTMRSTDNGKTWTGPIQVNDVDNAAREGLHAMAAGPKGELCCVWLDLRNRSTELMASISVDGGRTWGKNTLVYKSPEGSICECCHPSVAFDGKGRLHVQWRNSLNGNRDIYTVVSSDRGKSFDTVTKLGEGTWLLDACPMDGGAIASTSDNVFSVGVATRPFISPPPTWRRSVCSVLASNLGSPRRKRGRLLCGLSSEGRRFICLHPEILPRLCSPLLLQTR